MAYVIGTAGHVDHGKTTLVGALTGTNTDRLKEEQERGLTIDLGFTFIDLPNSGRTGIVDVPGHQDFIENMLAGVGGIDLGLLVIAADEGVMPQTQEHLDILYLLNIPQLLVALTKVDLIDDADWLELVELDVTGLLEEMGFSDVSIVPVSSVTGMGLPDLIATLDDALQQNPIDHTQAITRLPVDRVFTVDGFGTVVTGTLLGGTLSVGQVVAIQPGSREARIRGIQNHGQALDVAQPGNRIAINLSGVDKDEIERGSVVTESGQLAPSRLLDVRIEHLERQSKPIRHNTELKFFSGASEAVARIRVIGEAEIAAGAAGWVQLALNAPVSVAVGDRFILRVPSPPMTIGGGVILDAHPPYQWRRFKDVTLAHFEMLESGTPEDHLLRAVEQVGAIKWQKLQADEALIAAMLESGQLTDLGDSFVASSVYLENTQDWLQETLSQYHAVNPLYLGMSQEAVRNQLGLERAAFNALLRQFSSQNSVNVVSGWVVLPSHEIHFDAEQQKVIEKLKTSLQENAFQTPSYSDVSGQIGEDLLQALLIRGDVVLVKNDILLDASVYQQAVEQVEAYIRQNEAITVTEARDLFQTSRKYVLGLLEHMDEVGITRRVENHRILR